MLHQKFDLYKEFGLERQAGAQGYITAYIHDQSQEFCVGRTRPAMLVVPGGGYAMRSDREKECVAMEFFAKGFNAFTLDYSVAPVKFPAQLLESAMAMLFIKNRKEEFFLSGKVSAVGFSAGGHLVGTLATMYDCEEIKTALSVKDCRDIRPDAVIFSYPVITSGIKTHAESIFNLCGDNATLRDRVSVEKHIGENTPPAFIWTTVNDNAVPSENSLLLAMAYKNAGVPFELHIFENGIHGLSLGNKESAFKGAEENYIRPDIAVWTDLALTWLKSHGFEIEY